VLDNSHCLEFGGNLNLKPSKPAMHGPRKMSATASNVTHFEELTADFYMHMYHTPERKDSINPCDRSPL
jgi:hypothetical protein